MFPDHVVLISDSMEACGMPDGDYELGKQAVHVHGNLATLDDGTIAGSATNLMKCMQTAISMGVPKEQAIKAATYTPVQSIHMEEHYGSLTPGKYADVVILNQNMTVKDIILHGKLLSF